MVKQLCNGHEMVRRETESQISGPCEKEDLSTLFGFAGELCRLCLVQLAKRRDLSCDCASLYQTYLHTVSCALHLFCKGSQLGEACQMAERTDDVRKKLPSRFLEEDSSGSLLAVEAVYLKRRVKLLSLRVLATYGVFVVKNDQFSVD